MRIENMRASLKDLMAQNQKLREQEKVLRTQYDQVRRYEPCLEKNVPFDFCNQIYLKPASSATELTRVGISDIATKGSTYYLESE